VQWLCDFGFIGLDLISSTNFTTARIPGRMNRKTIFVLLLAIGCNVVAAALSQRVDYWDSETGRIAAHIASGQGFSSPFHEPTGPSAWIPPVYPYLLAAIFRIFGVFSRGSYWIAVAINIAVHALTSMVLYRAAGEAFGSRVGYYSACVLASSPLLFYPTVQILGEHGRGLFIPPNIIWYTHLSELAIVILIWFTLHPPRWILYGTNWGIAALINPAILAVAPAFLAWHFATYKSWRYLSLTLFIAASCVTPWLIRNYSVFHRPVFIRDNFGVELRVGNQPGQHGRWSADLHPDSSDYELRRVSAMGEADYARACGEEALRSIAARPGAFLANVIRRIGYWWIGNPIPGKSRTLGRLKFLKYLPQLIFSVLAFVGAIFTVRQRNHQGWLFVAVLVLYPLIYYITHTFEGGFFYQYPMHPEMLALATAGICNSGVLGLDSGKREQAKTLVFAQVVPASR